MNSGANGAEIKMKIAEDLVISADNIKSEGFAIKDFLELHMLCEIC